MGHDPKNDWTDAEAALLRSLRDATPAGGPPESLPDHLEERIVDALKRRGRIRAGGGRTVMIAKTAGIAAAAAAVFAVGFFTGNRNAPASEPAEPETAVTLPAPAGNEYMLFMVMRARDAAREEQTDPAAMNAIIAEYRQWAMDRQAEGRLVAAEKLAPDVRVMTAAGDGVRIASTLPSDRVVGGYFLIRAANLDEAIAIAESHPHLKYGGEVEVRPIDVLSR